MRKLNIYCVGLVLNLVWVPTTHAADTATINKTVSQCIEFVHSLAVPSVIGFDAYYNSSTGAVENNWTNAYNREPVFQFNKCMAQHGLPLGPKPKKPENN
jgi:hypothetical protein